MDSGITAPADLLAALKEMEQISKNKYDFVVIHMDKLPSKGNKIDFGISIGKKQEAGESEKKYEGKDLSGDAVFEDVKDMILSEYKDDACCVQFYLNYTLEGNRTQNKLMFLTWIPEGTNGKKKMVMSSTSRTLVKKAPRGAIPHLVNDADDLNFKDFRAHASANKAT